MRDDLNQIPLEHLTNLVWATMHTSGIGKITAYFSGGGDSGAIDDLSTDPDLENGYSYVVEQDLNTIVIDTTSVLPTITLYDLVEQLSNRILNRAEIPDWYNNDGGNGEIVWTLKNDGTHTIETTVNVAVTAYETYEFNHAVEDNAFVAVAF